MFYKNTLKLCKDNGISLSKLVSNLGMGKSNVTYWKNGSMPHSGTVKKVADYFGVSTDYLLADKEQIEPEARPTPKPMFTQEDVEILFRIKNLSVIERKEVESFIQFKESAKNNSETSVSLGK